VIGQQLVDSVGAGKVTSVTSVNGPIAGDPEPVIQIAATGFLTTGDLAAGESGDASGLPEMSIETWFDAATIPAANTFIVHGPAAGPNRQWSLVLNATGTITFGVENTTPSLITVTSPAAISTGTWYHLCGTITSGLLHLFINGVEVATSGGGAWSPAFVATSSYAAGTADMRVGNSGSTITMLYADMAFYRYGLTAARVLAHYTAGRLRGYNQQATGARIGAVLDTVASQAPRRIGTGVRSVIPVYMSGQPPLDEIRTAVAAEAVDADFFTASDGTLVFLDSAHRSSSPYDTPQAIFGDAAGELGYTDLNLEYADSFIANEWTVTRTGSSQVPGQTQTASDAASISRYKKRPQSLTGLPVVSDADASTVATAMLAKYKSPMQVITSLTFSTLDPAVAEAIFRRELGDKITVKRTPPGGGARISQDLFIQKIEVSGSNDGGPLVVRFGVSPL
jgi:Concanavalin A-like lectin/glucanases superfamily